MIAHQDIIRYPTPRAIKRPLSRNGVAVRVILHLHNGLVSIFRLCSAADLFVDAICIGQADVTEKAQEVASMDNITE